MIVEKFKRFTIKLFGGYDYYRLNYSILTLGLMWLLKREYFEPTIRNSILFHACKGIFWAMNFVVPFDMITDGYLVREDAAKLTYSLSTSVFYFASLYHFFLFYLNKVELEACLHLLNNNFFLEDVGKSEEDVKILKTGENQLRSLFKLFYFFALLGMVTRIVCHLAPKEKTMLLPFPYADDLVSPMFEIMFSFQIFGLTHFLTILVASQMVILGYQIRIIKHFEILTRNISRMQLLFFEGEESYVISKTNPPNLLKGRLPKLFGSTDSALEWQKKKTEELIKNTVLHHQQILSMVTRMNEVLGNSFFLQIFGGGLVLGILFVDLIWKSKDLSMKIIAQSVYAGAFLLNTSILCFFGSKIEAKSHQAANSLYGVPWLEMDLVNRRSLSLFLFSLWKHPVLRAARIFPVNLKTYVNFLFLIYDSVGFMNKAVGRNK